ncbi:MAG: hydroxymethylbilane synthase, partial [Thiotrichales bacterium]|nr:hydroxymethylbilane synthase [Thiotrichales bacterium]
LIRELNDPRTSRLVATERIISQRLYGGCQLPIAAHAEFDNEAVGLRAMVGRLDGSEILRARATAAADNTEAMAGTVVEQLLQQGADKILEEVLGGQA